MLVVNHTIGDKYQHTRGIEAIQQALMMRQTKSQRGHITAAVKVENKQALVGDSLPLDARLLIQVWYEFNT